MYNMVSFMLRYYREKCGYTQQNVADQLNIERSTYTYYETGKTMPDIRTLMTLAKIFGVNYTDLLEGTGDEAYSNLNDYTNDDDVTPIPEEERFVVTTNYEKELIKRIRFLTSTQRKEIMGNVRLYSDANIKSRNKPIRNKKKKDVQLTEE